MDNYILDEHGNIEAVPVFDVNGDVDLNGLQRWAKSFEETNRRVDRTYLPGGVMVSSVFLGLDHGFSFGEKAKPVLFETMVFGGVLDGYQERSVSWEESAAAHVVITAMVRTRWMRFRIWLDKLAQKAGLIDPIEPLSNDNQEKLWRELIADRDQF
jgi:hypothetical protein